MNIIVTKEIIVESPSTLSLPITPGRLKRSVALGFFVDNPAETLTVRGELQFLKAGSVVATLKFSAEVKLLESATHRLSYCTSLGDWAPFFVFADSTALLPYFSPGSQAVWLTNGCLAVPLECGLIDCDSVNVVVSVGSVTGGAGATGSVAIISCE